MKMEIDISTTRQKLEDAINGGATQADIAKEIGVSRSQISQFLKDAYKGDNEGLVIKIEKWLEQQVKKRQMASTLPSAPEYVPTPTSEKVISALTYAHVAGDLVIAYGGAGVGKTEGIKRYAKSATNVWVIEATPSRNTGGAFLRSVAFATGVRIPRGHSDILEMAILERLKGTQGLLIVDEAQFLNDRALENARRIAELAGIGLAFVGNESVYGQLTGQRRAADYAQLFSRIGKRIRLTRPTKQDVSLIAQAWSLGKEETEYAQEIASRPGALRGLNKTLRLASIFAAGQPLTLNHIKAAWADLSGE